MRRSWLALSLGWLFLASCSLMNHSEQVQLRNAFIRSDHQLTGSILKDADFYTDKKNALLANLEKGMREYSLKNYRESLVYLEQAKDLIDQYFTKSVSQTVATYLNNDTSADYVGENYERSLVYFYAALNHFHLAHASCASELQTLAQKAPAVGPDGEAKAAELEEEGVATQERCVPLTVQQKRQELFAARAELVAWHNFLQNLKQDKQGHAVFKDDLLACLFGGLVHEAIGGNDLQIAWQLYKDGLDILMKNYNAYATFNMASSKFVKDYPRLPTLTIDQVLRDYVRPTSWGHELKDYLTFKFLQLTKKLHPDKYESSVRSLHPRPEVLERLKKEKHLSNVAVVVAHDLIANKHGHRVSYSLADALKGQNKNAVNLAYLYSFARDVLGLTPRGDDISLTNAFLGTTVAAAAVHQAGISFEIPEIIAFPVQEQLKLHVLDQNGAEVYATPLVVVDPVSEIAAQTLKEQAPGIYTRLGARLAIKHAVAIIAAYTAYQNSKKDFIARTIAVSSYLIAAKAIEASEQADLRHWATLAADYRMADFYLPPGQYQLKAEIMNAQGEEKREVPLGDLVVEKNDPIGKIVASYRVY